jgi:hypothetical protein
MADGEWLMVDDGSESPISHLPLAIPLAYFPPHFRQTAGSASILMKTPPMTGRAGTMMPSPPLESQGRQDCGTDASKSAEAVNDDRRGGQTLENRSRDA